jgi:PTS system ascorbate-specific IIA component
MLKDLLKENFIDLDIVASTWEESIRLAAQSLLREEFITEQYIDNMVESVNQLGPYMVIMPHIAFAHAKPGPSVLKPGISLSRLVNPVKFNSKHNDPVKVIFTLAANDGSSHMQGLSDLAMFLSDSTVIDLLENGTKDEILDILKNY